jgi:hypothetical protein
MIAFRWEKRRSSDEERQRSQIRPDKGTGAPR